MWAHSDPEAGPRLTADRPELLRCNSFRHSNRGCALFGDGIPALPRTWWVRTPQRVDSHQLVSTGTSTVTDLARTPATVHPALGPTDHRTPRRSTITTSPRTQSRTRPAGVTEPNRPSALMRPAPAQPFGAGSFLGAACERSECAVPSPARQGRGHPAGGARAGRGEATTCVTGACSRRSVIASRDHRPTRVAERSTRPWVEVACHRPASEAHAVQAQRGVRAPAGRVNRPSGREGGAAGHLPLAGTSDRRSAQRAEVSHTCAFLAVCFPLRS